MITRANYDGSHLNIFILVSKMDQLRQGRHVIIAATGSELCPVECLRLIVIGQVSGERTMSTFYAMCFLIELIMIKIVSWD